MSLLRTFIAVEIPHPLQETLQQKTKPLRQSIGSSIVRWVPSENIHLTLKFLGNVSSANIDMLTQMLHTLADSCSSFDIHLNGLGSFPSPKRPRVLFIGIQAPAELEALWRGVESETTRLGYESEKHGFSPHLTLGRVRQNSSTPDQQKIRRALEETKIDSLGTTRVDSVHLYKSELKPTGSVYTKLYSAPLQPIEVKTERT
jgi:2'-5' RNA ligase